MGFLLNLLPLRWESYTTTTCTALLHRGP